MASFNNAITENGRLMLAHAQAGAVLIPTRIVIGSGNIPAGQTLATMTEVVSPVKELTINKKEAAPDGKYLIGGVYSNADISTAFYFRELAVFMCAEYRNADGTISSSVPEVLYSYGNSGTTADYMPAYSTSTVVEKQIDLVVWVGNTATVDLSIASGVYLTREVLDQVLVDFVSKTELEGLIVMTDATTNKKYRWGVSNGLIYIEEVG